MTDMVSQEEGTVQSQLATLREEHRELDARIAGMADRPYLSAEEQVEVARLKKLKLKKKEQIYRLAQQLGVDP